MKYRTNDAKLPEEKDFQVGDLVVVKRSNDEQRFAKIWDIKPDGKINICVEFDPETENVGFRSIQDLSNIAPVMR